MATLSDVRTDVRDHLDEATAAYWGNTELDRWINEATRDIARRAEVLQSVDNIDTVAGTQEYTMASNTLRVYRVEWIPSSSLIYPLEYRDFHSMDQVWWTQQETQEGFPYWYTMWGFPPNLKLIAYPTPSEVGVLRVRYYRLPTEAENDGDTLEVPQGWHDLISLWCEFTALRKDADPRWQEAKALYEERLGDMIDLTRRWTDQADSFQMQGLTLPRWLYDG